MTTTLITGKGGTPHITSGDMGAMQAGVIGNGSYLLQGSDGTFPTVTMQDANHALIPVLNLVVEGRYARVTEAETATIESGMSGQNRNDLVCLKYTRNSQNIETAAIAVLKGTPNTGTPPTRPSRRAASTRPPTRRGSRSPASRSAGSRPARRSCSSNSCLPCRNCGIP